MAIDAATRARARDRTFARGSREGSLLACIDRTVTSAGGPLLAERLARPLTDVAAITTRLDAVQFFLRRGAPPRRASRTPPAGDLARA